MVQTGFLLVVLDYLEKRKRRDLNLPLLSQQDAKTMFSKRMGRPVKQGIVCECCKHQCSMREMVEYCNMGSPGRGFNGGHRRHGRTVSQSRAKKWISAPDVVTNNAGAAAAVAEVEDAHMTNRQPGSRLADDNNDAGTILNYLTLLPSPVDPEESMVAIYGGNTATEYDLIKEALLSNPRDYAEDITLLENFINTELDPVSKRLFDTSDNGRHSSYVTNDDSNSESSEINMTSDRNLNQILTRNRNYENLERFVPNSELSPGWLQTKLAHIDSLDKVSDWLRELGAPGLKLNDKHKISNKIEDEGCQ